MVTKWKPLVGAASSVRYAHQQRSVIKQTLHIHSAWSLLSRPAKDTTVRVKDAQPFLNVFAFLGGGTQGLLFGTATVVLE